MEMAEFASEITQEAKMMFGGFQQRPGLQSRRKGIVCLEGVISGMFFQSEI